MRSFILLAFDDFIVGTGAVYTSAAYDELLATADQLALFAVTDGVTSSSGLSVQLEHSSDRRNWSNKVGTAEIDRASISSAATSLASGYDAGTNPSSCFVRARLFLDGAVTAHVKLWITGRVQHTMNGPGSSVAKNSSGTPQGRGEPPKVSR
jgi:hypothetical protein